MVGGDLSADTHTHTNSCGGNYPTQLDNMTFTSTQAMCGRSHQFNSCRQHIYNIHINAVTNFVVDMFLDVDCSV